MSMYVHRNTIKIFTVVNKTLQKIYNVAKQTTIYQIVKVQLKVPRVLKDPKLPYGLLVRQQ